MQDEVEKALRRLNWQGKYLLAAGRTDTGVHAAGQVIAFDMIWQHSDVELRQALNANLPRDIVAREVKVAQPGFHPRRDALYRRYHYHVFIQDIRDPLRERYAWRVWPPADLKVLQQTAKALIGKHDFAAFGTPPRQGGSTVRTVFEAGWFPEQDRLVFEVTANAFLYHMVRRMVHLQVEIGKGKIASNMLPKFLDRPVSEEPVSLVQGLAPPFGLTLMEVKY